MAKELHKPAELTGPQIAGFREIIKRRGAWVVLVDQPDQRGIEAREKTWRSALKVLRDFPAAYPDISQHLNEKFGISFRRRYSYDEAVQLAHWTLEAHYMTRPKPIAKLAEEARSQIRAK